ncbi:Sir2 family NAD+-dependent deacetylase [Glaciecola petra]|uniref:NAD-dependent protein deacylase n=1 Tax=Glaciecola petra TaxID=3075602 RepID=A0ABU2ZL47_9ALTE|nr:Sir2 family NAD+-dependent deacetylase [Aestuariibacter sp. P117]MDT0593354.1 NAD-dependent protein deacylase [Aestuariibacter sp. P117]
MPANKISTIASLKNKKALKIVVLTGAGISAESGIKTFRDNNGLWENHSVEEVATPEGFAANPGLVYRFYNERRQQLLSPSIKPNEAHNALAKLEQGLGNNVVVVTQNVDNLHERAGNKNVIHMHGELLSVKCPQSNKSIYTESNTDATMLCECCKTPNSLRPDIVWFGEVPYHMDRIEQHLYQADIFVSIGTSGNVYPAAGFVSFANSCGAHTVELNLEPSETESQFEEKIHGPASVIVPQFVEDILA